MPAAPTRPRVSAGRVRGPDGSYKIAYFGNGLKSALNTFAATKDLEQRAVGEDYYCQLARPFPPGHKRTLPVYYSARELFSSGTETWRSFEQSLFRQCNESFGRKLIPELRPRSEEPDMLYIALLDPGPSGGQRKMRAAILVRNSGTEEKTSVHLRGDAVLRKQLDTIGEGAVAELSRLLKRSGNLYAEAERTVLARLRDKGPLEFKELVDLLGGVDPQRLLTEVSIKEGFIAVRGDRLVITPLGSRVLEALEMGEER